MQESRPEPPARRVTGRGAVASLLVILVAAVCVRLGFWQLDRLEQRRERNEVLREALALPPVALRGDSLEALLRDPEAFLYRRVRVEGAYVPEGEVLLRGRAFRGQPGVHLLTPLRMSGTPWSVVVERGWAPSPDAMMVDPRPLAEPGLREVEGLLLPYPEGPLDGRALETEVEGVSVASVQRLDSAYLHARAGAPFLPAYVQQLPSADGASGAVQRLPPPALDEGPHLGYAVQWFSFAGIAVLGSLVLLFRSRRRAP